MNSDFFTPRRQFLRVMAHDWRAHRTDFLWGTFYALIGFYITSPAHDGKPVQLIAPFFLLGLAMGFLTWRVCAAERTRGTADLYFNLPRQRMRAWMVHVTMLATAALALESLVFLGAGLRLNLKVSATGYAIAPHSVLLPLFVMAVMVWGLYRPFPKWGQWGEWCQIALMLALVYAIPFGLVFIHLKPDTLRGGAEALVFAGFLGLTLLILADSRRAWRKTQIGALS